VILGDGTSATVGLREATRTIPVIFVQVTDPVGTGLVSSLATPGGNVTGFSNYAFSMGGKWLDILRQISPGVKRVGVLYNPQVGPFGKLYAQAISEASMATNIKIEVAQVADTNGMELFVDSLSPDYEALIRSRTLLTLAASSLMELTSAICFVGLQRTSTRFLKGKALPRFRFSGLLLLGLP
jgi:putative ABC transport system substrate-binding protein